MISLLLLCLSVNFSIEVQGLSVDEEGRPREESGRPDDESSDALMARATVISNRALRFLVTQQRTDGSFGAGTAGLKAPIAVTALAALAFMANGHTPDKGEFQVPTRRSIIWLIDNCPVPSAEDLQRSRSELDQVWGYFTFGDDNNSKMHGQGFATLALAEAYGMFGITGGLNRQYRERLHRCLIAAIKCINDAQTRTGGWGYLPVDTFHEGSVTITQIQALRAARNSGLVVDPEVIARAVQYVRNSQWLEGERRPNFGGFRYQINDDRVTYALTAAAVSTLNATGEYDSEAIERGLDFMARKDPYLKSGEEEQYRFYSRFYATQAYFQHRNIERFWKSYYPRMIERIENDQDKDDGSFRGEYGPSYGAAMSALTLAIPFGFLPIFQR